MDRSDKSRAHVNSSFEMGFEEKLSSSSNIAAELENIPSVQDLTLRQLRTISRSIQTNLNNIVSSRKLNVLSVAENVLQRCEIVTDIEAIFSKNEDDSDDITTPDLSLILVPFIRGELLSGCPASGPEQRLRMIQSGLSAYSRFLSRAHQYNLLGEVASRQFNQDQEHRGMQIEAGPVAMSQMTDRRQLKIDRFKAEKAISAKLAVIESRRKKFDQDDDSQEITVLGGGELDEEEERQMWKLKIEYAALRTLEQRASCLEEVKLLQHAVRAMAASSHTSSASGMENGTGQEEVASVLAMERTGAGAADLARQEAEEKLGRMKVLQGLRGVAAHLSSSSSSYAQSKGSTASTSSMPFSTSAASTAALRPSQYSEVAQVLAGLSSSSTQRETLMAGVFRPSHVLPTMTVEEFGEMELRNLKDREKAEALLKREQDVEDAMRVGSGPSREEREDEEVWKQRDKDDWRDATGRPGWGNSALRPCGR
ncbi:hypothetical protein CEUSTIGMA_g12051.t1 [Chlamydomonas eustigma]|uniref:TAP42-like protein n=1 Tax=Chlamydomonas eustigma TaxID=1157962 RepID=A0A250XPA2_9CHLO|nr:hypothetical protein CEUSTIGMA_g12051.t1 [Chlamydomonas eustigma]|eukprot:GAX84630.1 hypothetical protein CEUSTIGMA_g12051.t1 [Chlamydomonas eustigma]